MCFAVVALEIVGAGVVVDVLVERAGSTEKLINGPGGSQQRRQGVRGGETAVVLFVVREQGDAGGEHGGEVGVVGGGGQIDGRLLGVAEVGIVVNTREEARIAG